MKKLISLVSMLVLAFAVTSMAAQEKTAKTEKKGEKMEHAAKAPKLAWATGTIASASADSITLNSVKPMGKEKEATGTSGDTLTLNVDAKTKINVKGAKATADLKSGEEVKVSYHANFPETGKNHAASIASVTAKKAAKKAAK